MDEEEERNAIDRFTEDLTNAVLSEGIVLGISDQQQVSARAALAAIGSAAKSLVGICPPGIFASALLTYGEAMASTFGIPMTTVENKMAGGRQIYQHVDEFVSTKDPDEEDDE